MHYSSEEIQSILISGGEISKKMDELAARVNADYAGKELLLVCILKGAVVVFAELLKRITIPCEIDFMALSSYGSSTKTTGVVRILKDLDHGIEGKDVLIVEDIVDSGVSMRYLLDSLSVRRAASVRIFSLLDKPSRRRVEIEPDYLGFEIPDLFVVGFGLDYAEKYRNLPDVCVLSESVYAGR
ncbi:MAG: hypoxanthine phosphoribosyltransferase [Christensenellaceae bacterium]|jgi:hypoxanthine phosphoribosyltransferase|nr:hypoxanthine phosphoribosyltransferase [Christensenellaceae bacterium]